MCHLPGTKRPICSNSHCLYLTWLSFILFRSTHPPRRQRFASKISVEKEMFRTRWLSIMQFSAVSGTLLLDRITLTRSNNHTLRAESLPLWGKDERQIKEYRSGWQSLLHRHPPSKGKRLCSQGITTINQFWVAHAYQQCDTLKKYMTWVHCKKKKQSLL